MYNDPGKLHTDSKHTLNLNYTKYMIVIHVDETTITRSSISREILEENFEQISG